MLATYACLMPRPAPIGQWHHLGLGSFTVTGATILVGTFLPWLHSGSRWRSSYDLFGLVQRLGFTEGGPIGLAVRAWPLVPLLVTVTVMLAWWRQTSLAVVSAVVVTAYTGGVAVALTVGARRSPVDLGIGPWVCSIASIAFAVNAGVLVWTDRRRLTR